MGNRSLSAPWPAPGKLNLGLRIIGRRDDGYHRLQTAFQFIAHCDFLRFTPRNDGQIRRLNDAQGIPEAQDLAIRAARLLQDSVGPTPGIDLHLDKRLPVGGGLGGGSSDAATTLVALNHYWGLGLPVSTLAALGLRLGADVPVFVQGHAAWGEAVGEVLTPITLPEPWFVILMPGVDISTRAVFQAPDLTRDSLPVKMRSLFQDHYRNDCEAVVFHRFPAVAMAARWLSRFARAYLTGTGSCVFAAFSRRQEAIAVATQAPCKALVSQGKNRSLLQERLQQETMHSAVGP